MKELIRLTKVIVSLLTVAAASNSALAQVYVSEGQTSGISEADLRFMRGESAPFIAREAFHFRRDGWIIGRIRNGNSEFWGLTVPQSHDNIEFLAPDVANRLLQMTSQIGADGPYRAQIEEILASGGLRGADLDAALEARDVVWNTGMGWANVFQARLNDTYILFVAFYSEHEFPNPATDVPVDAALVALPGAELPVNDEATAQNTYAATEDDRRMEAGSPSPPSILQRNPQAAMTCVQRLLTVLNLEPGPVDGLLGSQTRMAAERLDRALDAALPTLTEDAAFEWCTSATEALPALYPTVFEVGRQIAFELPVSIFVATRPPDALVAEGLNGSVSDIFYVVSDVIADDPLQSVPLADEGFDATTLYVFNDVRQGASLATEWCFRLDAASEWFCDRYEYEIETEPPGGTVFVLNASNARVAGQFRYRAWVNGAETGTRNFEVR